MVENADHSAIMQACDSNRFNSSRFFAEKVKNDNLSAIKNRLDLAKRDAAKTLMQDKIALLDSHMKDS